MGVYVVKSQRYGKHQQLQHLHKTGTHTDTKLHILHTINFPLQIINDSFKCLYL